MPDEPTEAAVWKFVYGVAPGTGTSLSNTLGSVSDVTGNVGLACSAGVFTPAAPVAGPCAGVSLGVAGAFGVLSAVSAVAEDAPDARCIVVSEGIFGLLPGPAGEGVSDTVTAVFELSRGTIGKLAGLACERE